MQNDYPDEGLVASLRQDPQRAATLLKIGGAGPLIVGAWVVAGSLVLSSVIVALAAVGLVFAYGAIVASIVSGIARHEASRQVASRRLGPASTHRQERGEPQVRLVVDDDEDEDAEPKQRPSARIVEESNSFHVTYFMNRLNEEVKTARRQGHQMSVVVLDVAIPGAEMTPAQSEAISQEVARIAAQHPQTISLQLSLGPSEFMFSMPHSDAKTTKEFVSQVIGALGRYWCHFGTASFPREATNAESLVDAAREACDTSRRDGTRGKVRHAMSA